MKQSQPINSNSKAMNEFINALISDSKNPNIPEEHDLFGRLIGEWEFEYIDNHGTADERHVAGEWIFSWVLDGTAIQDIFICPSREERLENPQADAEYGSTLRIYNQMTKAWDVFYGCTGCAGGGFRLEARKVGSTIVLTEITMRKMQWIFSDMTDTSFHWRNTEILENGTVKLNCELFATRMT